jgi:hypothetical protein
MLELRLDYRSIALFVARCASVRRRALMLVVGESGYSQATSHAKYAENVDVSGKG